MDGGAVCLGSESDKLPVEKEFFVDLRGVLEDAREEPRAGPRRSEKRLGLEVGMPMPEEEEDDDDDEVQVLPKISPTMEGEGLAKVGRGAADGAG